MSEFLKRIEQNTRPGASQKQEERIQYSYIPARKCEYYSAGRKKNIYHNLKTEDINVRDQKTRWNRADRGKVRFSLITKLFLPVMKMLMMQL